MKHSGMAAGQVIDGEQATIGSVGGESNEAVQTGAVRRNRLKSLLRALDLLGLAAGWWLAHRMMVALAAAGPEDRLQLFALGLTGVIAALVVMASRRLWLARVCAVRSAELEGLGQMAVISALVVLAAGQLTDQDAPDRFALLGALNSFVLVTALRAAYSGWLRRARRGGRFARRLVLVGANTQSFELARLIGRHPETGFDIIGVCGPPALVADLSPDVPWLGESGEAAAAVSRAGATGALVVASAFEPPDLNRTLRQLLGTGCHVHLSSGIRGISHERLLPLPLAREPLFYLERMSLTRSQLNIKRVMDVVVGSVLLVLTLPVLAVAAAAVKLHDGGEVLFRQRRIGHRGREFTLYKLRTMVPDAESRQADLAPQNVREGGPLFKLAQDPRVTRIGRFLRVMSIDELPQLFNVLRGDMSLIGPRPALPREVAQFDDELRQRGRMMPGITGLWQVEARDDPSFDTYRRLDLYYVENWSIGLDLAILFATVGVVISRALRMLLSSTGPA